MASLAPESLNPYSSSSPDHQPLSDTEMAPEDVIAMKAMTHSG